MTKQEKEEIEKQKYNSVDPIVLKYGIILINQIIDLMTDGLGWDEIKRELKLAYHQPDYDELFKFCSRKLYLDGKLILGTKKEAYFTEQEALNGFVFDGKLSGWELEQFNNM
jgi:hypothetical protein